MMIEPAVLTSDPGTGVTAPATGRYEKRLRDLDDIFHDAQAYDAREADPDRLVYEVYEVYDHRTEERASELIFGTSILQPGRIGREFHFTRGHVDRLADRSEIYHCLSGRGVMLMETLDGELRALALEPGQTVHVPGHWIYRSVNVGAEPFVTLSAIRPTPAKTTT